MGLDIYAGTLTRYYAHNWKTVVQQWAEKNGWGFQRVTPEGDAIAQEEELTPTEIQKAIEHWRDGILEALVTEGQPPFPAWTEDNETPYYTDKPDWDAFEALLLFGACRIYDMPVPEQFPKHGQFEQFEAAGRMQADENMNWSLFTGAVWWLPLEECFVFRAPLPTGDEAVLGTAGTLLGCLLAARVKKDWLVPVPIMLANAVLVGAMLAYVLTPTALVQGFFINGGEVLLGEAVVLYLLGVPLLVFFRKNGVMEKLMKEKR